MRMLSGQLAHTAAPALRACRAQSGAALNAIAGCKHQLLSRLEWQGHDPAHSSCTDGPHFMPLPTPPEADQQGSSVLSVDLRRPLHPAQPSDASFRLLPSDATPAGVGRHRSLHVQLNEPPQQRDSDDQKKPPDYYANVGDAIRTLRDDIPLLFKKELDCEWP